MTAAAAECIRSEATAEANEDNRGREGCLICCSHSCSNTQQLLKFSVEDHIPGGSMSEKDDGFKLDNDTNLDLHLTAIFVLRRVLCFPKENCETLMKIMGGLHPGEWFKLCDACFQLVKQVKETYQLISTLERRIVKERRQVKNKMKESILAEIEKEECSSVFLASGKDTIRLYYYFRDQESSSDEEVILPHHRNYADRDESVHYGNHDDQTYISSPADKDKEKCSTRLSPDEENSDQDQDGDSNQDDDQLNSPPPHHKDTDGNLKPPYVPVVRSSGERRATRTSPRFNRNTAILARKYKEPTESTLETENERVRSVENKSTQTEEMVKSSCLRRRKVKDNDSDIINNSKYYARCQFDKSLKTCTVLHVTLDKVENDQYKCRMCKESLPKNAISTHVISQHTNRTTCKHCGKIFKCVWNMTAHVKIAHEGVKTNDIKICPICGKPLPKRSTLVVHKWTHYSEEDKQEAIARGEKCIKKMNRNLKCDQCDKIFSTKDSLRVHKLGVHGERKKKVCPKCGMHVVNFRVHNLRIHGGKIMSDTERKFVCSLCNKEFAMHFFLVVHRRQLHEKPFKCTICEKQFGRKCKLTTHMNIHLNIMPYKCDICGKGFPSTTSLHRHGKIHQKKTPKPGTIPRKKTQQKVRHKKRLVKKGKLRGTAVNK